ncbi:EpsG family protein [Vibrio cyclitrophicus]
MVYILLILFTALLVSISEKLASRSVLLLSLVPYFLVASIQSGVGTDYYNYLNIYTTSVDMDRFYQSNEFVFYFAIKLFQYFDFPGQSVFVFSAFVNTILFYFILRSLKRCGYTITIVFIIFMLVTGIYQNQLNGIRNYSAILSFILCFLLFFEKRYFSFALVFIWGVFSHFSFLIVLPVFAFLVLSNGFLRRLWLIFLISPVFYLFILPGFVENLVSYVFPKYAYLLASESLEQKDFMDILPKIILLPIYLLSVFSYSKSSSHLDYKGTLHYGMNIFVFSYFIFLTLTTFSVFSRPLQYFSFFYIFPIYYLVVRFNLISKKLSVFRYFLTIMLIISLAGPFIAKATFFKANEYDYKTIIFSGEERS